MAKESLIVREKKRAVLAHKYKNIRRFLKGKVKQSDFLDEKLYYHNFLQKLSKDSSFTRLF
jgi:hypothetical protein